MKNVRNGLNIYGEFNDFRKLQNLSNAMFVTPKEDLASAYARLCAAPNMGTISATNRRTLILMPGVHTLTSTLTLDTDFVDILGIGAPSDTLITGNIYSATANTALVKQMCDDIRISNLTFRNTATSPTSGKVCHTFIVNATDNSSSRYENVHFRHATPTAYHGEPVRGQSNLGGTWRNCVGDDYSFRCADSKNLSATMYDCVAGTYSFGGDNDNNNSGTGQITGTLYRCIAGRASFGGCDAFGCSISGTLYDCVAGGDSYALSKTISGKLYRCIGSQTCFAASGTFAGYAESCYAEGYGSFASGIAGVFSGVLKDCVFDGAYGLAAGTAFSPGNPTIVNNAAKASLTVNMEGDGGTITFTALRPGIGGNLIGISRSLASSLSIAMTYLPSSTDYVVNIIIKKTSAPTAVEVANAVNADALASRLVVATYSGAGTGTFGSFTLKPLTGGVDGPLVINGASRMIAVPISRNVPIHWNGYVLTNAGATADVTLTLPPALPGLGYTIRRSEAGEGKDVRIDPQNGDDIELVGGTQLTDGFYIENAADEIAECRIWCDAAGHWRVLCTGTWTAET